MKYKNFRNVKVLVSGTKTATVDEVRLFSTKPVEVYLECTYPLSNIYASYWRYKDTGKHTLGNDIESMYNTYKVFNNEV